MANIRKWIAEARDLEESGDLQGALSVYRKALVAQEETSGFADLSLYNGLGDLHMRAGEPAEAIAAYESAAARCEDQQLYANGIALCKKILRNAPEHSPVYRRVGRLFALSGLHPAAVSNYREYARRCLAAGHDDLALEARRELVELTADEEAAVELADALVEGGRTDEALAMLRAARDQRDRAGRDFVMLLRRIQDLQPAAESEDDDGGTAADPAAAEPMAGEPESAKPVPSHDVADTDALTAELTRVLAASDGVDRYRHALPIVDHLLELEPGRFDLLHRKLAYAFALGDEEAAIAAYLALGECLDRELTAFRLRTLSSATPAGSVTAALKIEVPSEMAPGS